MPQFDILTFPGQIFWLVLMFSLHYFLIQKFISPALQSIVDKRNSYIQGCVKQAEDYTSQAEKMHMDYERKIADAKQVSFKLINNATSDAQKLSESILAALEQKFSNQLRNKENQFLTMPVSDTKILNNMSVELSVELINKITDRKVGTADLMKYIN